MTDVKRDTAYECRMFKTFIEPVMLKDLSDDLRCQEYECSECEGLFFMDEYSKPNYCPHCGAKVMQL